MKGAFILIPIWFASVMSGRPYIGANTSGTFSYATDTAGKVYCASWYYGYFKPAFDSAGVSSEEVILYDNAFFKLKQ